jgi:acyl-CoA thioesterase
MLDADVAARQLGIDVREIARGRATVVMTVAETMVNGHGLAHGGYVFLLADTAFAVACNTYGETAVARACDIVFLRPAKRGDELVAVAVERSRVGRSGLYDVTVRRADGEVVAEMRGQSATVNGGRQA